MLLSHPSIRHHITEGGPFPASTDDSTTEWVVNEDTSGVQLWIYSNPICNPDKWQFVDVNVPGKRGGADFMWHLTQAAIEYNGGKFTFPLGLDYACVINQ